MNKYSLGALLWSVVSGAMLLRAIFYEKIAIYMGYVYTEGFGSAQIIEAVIWTAMLILSVHFFNEWKD